MALFRGIILIGIVVGAVFAAEVEDILYDDTMLKLQSEIAECVRRQSIIAHNIANADVEGYEPIRFEEELQELKKRPGFTKDKVIIEEEMAKMTKNRMKHQVLLKIYGMKNQTVKQVISQGK